MTAQATISFAVPAGLKYDGVQEVGPAFFLQFTEHDQSSPSYGATFYVAAGQVIESDIAARRIEVRKKFSSAVGNGAQRDPATTADDLVHETAAAGSVVASAVPAESPTDTFAEMHGVYPPNEEIGGS